MTLRTADFKGSRISTNALKSFSRRMSHCVSSKECRFHPRHKQATYKQFRDYLEFTLSQYNKIGSIILGRARRTDVVQIQRVARGFLSRRLTEELRLLTHELR